MQHLPWQALQPYRNGSHPPQRHAAATAADRDYPELCKYTNAQLTLTQIGKSQRQLMRTLTGRSVAPPAQGL